MSDVRLLFDQNEPTQVRSFQISPTIQVQVVCALQKEPGALQSGIYLWPAALSLSTYLCTQHATSWNHIVEFGAGCGMIGLAACQVLSVAGRAGSVTFTDRDWASLNIIKKSLKRLHLPSDISTPLQQLTWSQSPDAPVSRFQVDLTVGSDLIYSTESAMSLLNTIKLTMPVSKPHWRFLLASSFRDAETTRIIDDQCQRLGLLRTVLEENYLDCLIEEFGVCTTE